MNPDKTSERKKQIAARRYPFVLRYCLMRVGEPADAEDLASEAILLFLNQAPDMDERASAVWLYRTAEHKLQEYYRRKKKKPLSLEQVDEPVDRQVERLLAMGEEPPLDEAALQAGKAEILRALSQQELQLYEAVFVAREDYGRLSQSLGISRNALAVRVFRLRARLRQLTRDYMDRQENRKGGDGHG